MQLLAIALPAFLALGGPAAAAESGPFLTSAELIALCRAKAPACETYIMAVYDAARAIQENTRNEVGSAEFTVLCDASLRPDVSAVVRRMLLRAERDPGELRKDPAVYIIQAINVPAACK